MLRRRRTLSPLPSLFFTDAPARRRHQVDSDTACRGDSEREFLRRDLFDEDARHTNKTTQAPARRSRQRNMLPAAKRRSSEDADAARNANMPHDDSCYANMFHT